MSDRLTTEPGITLDRAKQALAILRQELGPEWQGKLDYVAVLMEIYTTHLHEILHDIEKKNLGHDGQLAIQTLLSYADWHQTSTFRGIAQSIMDNLEVNEERLRGRA